MIQTARLLPNQKHSMASHGMRGIQVAKKNWNGSNYGQNGGAREWKEWVGAMRMMGASSVEQRLVRLYITFTMQHTLLVLTSANNPGHVKGHVH